MKKLKKSSRNEELTEQWKKDSGSFVRKPAKGWIHPDHKLMEDTCVTYQTQFVGLVKVLESVKSIPFEQRGALVREAIMRCCLASKLFDAKKKKKSSCVDPVINNRLGNICLDHSGALTSTRFSRSFIETFVLSSGEMIFNHNIQCISFASIGENDYRTLIAYISKDASFERACFVFDCKGDIADDIILTIGQAFELKYKEFLSTSTNIQAVPKKFTDPIVEKCGTSAGSNSSGVARYSSLTNRTSETYDELYPESKPLPSAPGYDSLSRSGSAPAVSPSQSPYDGLFAAMYEIPSTALDNIPDAVESNEMCKPEAGLTHQQSENPYYLSSVDEVDQGGGGGGVEGGLSQHTWYHGNITRSVAEKCLKCDGDFLVRKSAKDENQYVLSGLRDAQYRHILLINPLGQVTTQDRTFTDIPELINFHLTTNTPIISNNKDIYLIREARNSAV